MMLMQVFHVFTGNPNNGLDYMNGMEFSTYDRDRDQTPYVNCAKGYHGAWWYRVCFHANPNGLYLTPGTHNDISMNYYGFRYFESLLKIKLMFR